MTELADGDFELGGVLLGGRSSGGNPIKVERFARGGSELRVQDVEDTAGDFRVFGRDWKTPPLWSFELGIDRRTPADALETLSVLESVWDAETVRANPGVVLPLRYRIGGRTRRVYGRPRRFTAPLDDLAIGYIPVTCDFDLVDALHYDDVEHSVTVDMTGSTNPLGISSPVRSPVAATFGLWTAPQRTAIVDGDRLTWPILEFQGGVNPWCEIAGWRGRVMASLNWDQVAVVDTRPWVRSSTLNGSYMSLDRGSRLQEMRVPPGRWPVHYGNDSSAGAPSVTVRWRNAWSSL